ncbi:MAG: hypothetical protein AAGA23_12345 [Pseudomonadota bacterium]
MIKTTTLLAIALYLPMSVQAQEERAEAFRTSFAETQQRLSLTEDQRSQVEPIVRAQFDATQAVMKKYGFTPGAQGGSGASMRELRAMSKELKPIRKQADKELAAVLSRDQMKEYKDIQEERQAKMREEIKQRRNSR